MPNKVEHFPDLGKTYVSDPSGRILMSIDDPDGTEAINERWKTFDPAKAGSTKNAMGLSQEDQARQALKDPSNLGMGKFAPPTDQLKTNWEGIFKDAIRTGLMGVGQYFTGGMAAPLRWMAGMGISALSDNVMYGDKKSNAQIGTEALINTALQEIPGMTMERIARARATDIGAKVIADKIEPNILRRMEDLGVNPNLLTPGQLADDPAWMAGEKTFGPVRIPGMLRDQREAMGEAYGRIAGAASSTGRPVSKGSLLAKMEGELEDVVSSGRKVAGGGTIKPGQWDELMEKYSDIFREGEATLTNLNPKAVEAILSNGERTGAFLQDMRKVLDAGTFDNLKRDLTSYKMLRLFEDAASQLGDSGGQVTAKSLRETIDREFHGQTGIGNLLTKAHRDKISEFMKALESVDALEATEGTKGSIKMLAGQAGGGGVRNVLNNLWVHMIYRNPTGAVRGLASAALYHKPIKLALDPKQFVEGVLLKPGAVDAALTVLKSPPTGPAYHQAWKTLIGSIFNEGFQLANTDLKVVKE